MENVLADSKNANAMKLADAGTLCNNAAETKAVLECTAIILSMLSLLLLNYL